LPTESVIVAHPIFYEYRKIRLFENHTKNVWVLFKKPKLVANAIAAKQKKIETN
jgi:hypothetical protein